MKGWSSMDHFKDIPWDLRHLTDRKQRIAFRPNTAGMAAWDHGQTDWDHEGPWRDVKEEETCTNKEPAVKTLKSIPCLTPLSDTLCATMADRCFQMLSPSALAGAWGNLGTPGQVPLSSLPHSSSVLQEYNHHYVFYVKWYWKSVKNIGKHWYKPIHYPRLSPKPYLCFFSVRTNAPTNHNQPTWDIKWSHHAYRILH